MRTAVQTAKHVQTQSTLAQVVIHYKYYRLIQNDVLISVLQTLIFDLTTCAINVTLIAKHVQEVLPTVQHVSKILCLSTITLVKLHVILINMSIACSYVKSVMRNA